MAAAEKAQAGSPIPHLWQIAAAGDVEQLKAILDRGADVNASNPSGLTPLMVAAYHGRLEMVRALIARGAEVNATDDEGLTAAMLADDAGHDEIVRMLVGGAVKRKRTAPAPETSASQASAPDSAVEPGPPVSGAPSVRTLHEPPDIWDMVHETQSSFNAGSAFFGRLTLRHCLTGAAILLMLGGISALCFVTLRRSAGVETTPALTQNHNPNTNLPAAAQSNANKSGREQRPTGKNARTTMAIRSIFDDKRIVAGAGGWRDAAVVATRAQSPANPAVRPSVALFHADDKKRTQKSNPHIGNSPTVAAMENGDRNQLFGSRPDNDKRANSTATRKETGKLPTPEAASPPRPNPSPKGKVIQWP